MVKVLIVEDDPMVAQINKKYIESIEGFEVINVIPNGDEALKFLERTKVDLVILDIYIYKLDGITVLKKMRQKHIMSDVILVTAAKDADKIDDALKLGAVDYLVKPFEYERLKKSLEDYLLRTRVLKYGSLIDQKDIDQIMMRCTFSLDDRLPKGLNKNTLERIIRYLENSDDRLLTSDEISDKLGVTKVTIRRYLDYLERIGTVKLIIEYGAIGRPSHRYQYLSCRKNNNE
ncbi:response regulator [Brassicibacter mesophilus]|uniref:response regulator n=1 Tax=Brassicibacter mesophilus TaxID=745119 RepID=UPI003D1E6A1B